MWTRVELKNYAKDFLRKHYWKAFVVCLIFAILSGNSNSNSGDNNRHDGHMGPNDGWFYEDDMYNDGIFGGNRDSREGNFVFRIGREGIKSGVRVVGIFPSIVIGSTITLLVVILFIVGIVIGPLIEVGKNRFFLRAFKSDVSIANVFSTFNKDEFWPIFATMFITSLKNLLWFLLLIIPGIIKSYEYQMVPYLVAEDSSLSSSEAIEISRRMTDGHKWNMFVLDLSFIGWNLLGSLLFGIGVLFVAPYYEATVARLYVVLSGGENQDEDYEAVY